MKADLRQVKQYAEYMKSLGWTVEEISGSFIYLRKIPLLGYFMKIQRPEKIIPVGVIENLRRKYPVFSVSVETTDFKQFTYYKNNGFKISKAPFLPSKTIYINLKKKDEELLKSMHSKTRYNLRLSERRGIVVKKSRDIDEFIDFWHKSAKKRGFYMSMRKEIESLFKPFGKYASLLFAFYNKELVSAVFLVTAGKVTYYMYAASTADGNKQFAPSLLVWKAFGLAKSLGSQILDFEGIYDDRFPLKAWRGFTRFKKGFGGKEVAHPPALRKYYFPLIR